MSTPRQPLYARLPEVYHLRDAEQLPPGQLRAYLDVLDEVFAGIRDDIDGFYHDLFIETCADWVVPYIADLLGTSHLSGDPWTLRADVARTVYHRRRKGTLGAIESLTYTLSGWATNTVELRERVAWNQHLNHQRADAGGRPPLADLRPVDAVRGGTVSLRDPALLSFFGGAFDPFAHVMDVRPIETGRVRYNLPNLAVFLWRLAAYTVPVFQPGAISKDDLAPLPPVGADNPDPAAFAVRAVIHPVAEPMVLFNTHRFQADDEPPNLTHPDAVPGPMPPARLTTGAPTGNPEAYVAVATYAGNRPDAPGPDAVGLTLHLPEAAFGGVSWRFRGANLCAWDAGLQPPLQTHEVAVDPERGRVLLGVAGEADEADPLVADLRISATHGFSGPTGAHPVPRPALPSLWQAVAPQVIPVDFHQNPDGLRDALANLDALASPLVIEIRDSMTHRLDLTTVAGIGNEGGEPALMLGRSLWIRAATGERPVIVLEQPLRFRPAVVAGGDALADLEVRLEGLYLTWRRGAAAFAAPETGLIRQAAVNRLALDGCTLDPGGSVALDGSATGHRTAMRTALELGADYGFHAPADEQAFDQIPILLLNRSIVGPVAADEDYALTLADSIVDGGSGPEETTPGMAISAASSPATAWAPPLSVLGGTCFGRVRVASVTGQGGIFVHRLEAHDNQSGCVKFSYFSGDGDRVPPHYGCVFGTSADLSFVSVIFGESGYGQLRLRSDPRILEQGPGRDAMGAFGYLRNAHKWKNISIRYREFMPVGVTPVMVPVT